MVAAIAVVCALSGSRLQLGMTWSGVETLHLINAGEGIDETHRFKRSFRVAGQESGMWVVEASSQLLGSKYGDVDIPAPKDSGPTLTREWLAPAGFLLDEEPWDQGRFRLDRLLRLWLPDNQPDTWSAELTTSGEHAVAKGKATLSSVPYTLKSVREYAFSFRETGVVPAVIANGRMRFEVKSGRLLFARLECRNVLLPGGVDRAGATLTYTDGEASRTGGLEESR